MKSPIETYEIDGKWYAVWRIGGNPESGRTELEAIEELVKRDEPYLSNAQEDEKAPREYKEAASKSR